MTRRERGASSSGRGGAARRLALAILENAPGLDARATEGAAEFLRRAPLAPSAARERVDG